MLSDRNVTIKNQVAAAERYSADEVGSFDALSNAELGDLFAATVRSYALRRTRSSRDHWRKLLDEPDMIALHAEFRRRALERAEEYEAWLQYLHAV